MTSLNEILNHAECKETQLGINPGSNYVCIKILGEGAYGLVCSASDKRNNFAVAIKRICPFDNTTFCVRTLREIKLLKFLRGKHRNLIQLVEIIRSKSIDELQEVFLVQELMESDLHRVIRSQRLTPAHCQYFAYQLLSGLAFLHSADIVHRDLKPSNLFVNSDCLLKIGDFGLARICQPPAVNNMDNINPYPSPPNYDGSKGLIPRSDSTVFLGVNHGSETGYSEIAGAASKEAVVQPPLTEYVATRWYRPPEILLFGCEYSKPIDLWAVGCIIAEMFGAKALFPGKNFYDQLFLIIDFLGTPSEQDIARISHKKTREFVQKFMIRPPTPLANWFQGRNVNVPPDALDMMEQLLSFDPHLRPTAKEALRYPFVLSQTDPVVDVEVKIPLAPFEIDLKQDRLTKQELKEMIWDEICRD